MINNESKPKQKKSKSKKIILRTSIGVVLVVVIIGGATVWNFNHKEVATSNNSIKVINTAQKGITANFFKSTSTKYYGQNYNVYLYNMYTRVRNSIMNVRYYEPMGKQGMAKTVPSEQLDLNIANWVKTFCTQQWYIESEKKVGNPNVPNTPERLSNIDFSNLEPQAILYVNYDQDEANLYPVPVYKLVKDTKGNDLGIGDGQQVFIFSSIKAAENSGLFTGGNPNQTIIRGNNEIVTTNQKVEENNAYSEKTQYVKTTKEIENQKDIIVPKSLYQIENNIDYNDVMTPNGEISIQNDVAPNTTISGENLAKVQNKVIDSIVATLEQPANVEIFPLANKERFKDELTTVIRQNLNLARIDGTKEVKEYGAMGVVNNSNYQYVVPVVNVAFGKANDSETYKKYFRLNITGSLAKSYGYNQIYVNVGFSDDRPTN